MSKRFVVLDGIRGVAALAVFAGHVGNAEFIGGAGTSFFLAVDLFFMLSGFVLAQAYSERLDDGWGFAAFAKARLIRLYPAYVLGTVISVARPLTVAVLSRKATLDPWVVPQFGAALFMVPVAAAALFPLNPPAWSLLFELIINVPFGTSRTWRSSPILLWFTAAISAIVLILLIGSTGSIDIGQNWGVYQFVGGLARVGFSFPIGVLIYQFREFLPTIRINGLVLILVVAALLCVPTPVSTRAIENIVMVLAVLPLLVMAGVQAKAPSPFPRSLMLWLGALSYPLYVMHLPLLSWADTIVPHLALSKTAETWVAVPVIILIAAVIERYFDRPVRTALSARRSAPAVSPAPPAGGSSSRRRTNCSGQPRTRFRFPRRGL